MATMLPKMIETSDDGQTWQWAWNPARICFARFLRTAPHASAMPIEAQSIRRTDGSINDVVDWPINRVVNVPDGQRLWTAPTPAGGWSPVEARFYLRWVQLRPADEIWDAEAGKWVASGAPTFATGGVVRGDGQPVKVLMPNGPESLISPEMAEKLKAAIAKPTEQTKVTDETVVGEMSVTAPSRLCGCGKHPVDPTGDVNVQHREWSCTRHCNYSDWVAGQPKWKPNSPEAKPAFPPTSMEAARGIGVSAPKPEPLAAQDPTGDDVARDAYRTTGGLTLDDIIDAHAAAASLEIGGKRHRVTSVEIEYAPDADGLSICTKYEVGTADGQVHRRLKSDDITITYE